MKAPFTLLLFGSLFAHEAQYCQIVDEELNASNREILQSVLEQELALLTGTPFERARSLNSRIGQIARAILNQGFSTEAYGLPEFEENSSLSYTRFAVWEGESSNETPITFFVYMWPSKEQALIYNADPLDRNYATCIHSHPIPCSFSVLQGSLVQKTYEWVVERTVRFIQEDLFPEGEGEVDDLQKPFIHQIYCDSLDGKACVSLHAYGLPTAEKVVQCFQDTYSEHSYSSH